MTETGSSNQGEGRSGAQLESAAVPKEESGWKAGPTAVALERSVLELSVSNLTRRSERIREPGAEFLVTDDDPLMGKALEDRLGALGHRVRRIPCSELAGLPVPEQLDGLIVVAPAERVPDSFLLDALRGVQHLGPSLRRCGGLLTTVSRLDGGFGLIGLDPAREPLDGGLAGLVKTADLEWTEVSCKALDMAEDFLSADEAAAAIVEEIFLVGPVEVGIAPGRRQTIKRTSAALPAPVEEKLFAPAEVIVISGGARGVTAEVAVALAREYQPTLVLLGRSLEPTPEPEWLTSLTNDAEIKRELRQQSPGLSVRELGDQCREVLAGREIRSTLERIQAAGARVRYCSVDVRDAVAVGRVLADVRREYGPVRGLLHGAGVLADARIEDKQPEQFDRVYDTKVEGLRSLLAAVGSDDLRTLILFSSSTARFGRVGQVDYAIANEVLNKLARQQARLRPGCRVISFNWGPWEGGMVTPGLARLFAREGIGLIPLDAGAGLLIDELQSPEQRSEQAVEVVVLARVPSPARSASEGTSQPARGDEPTGKGEQTVAHVPPLPSPLPAAFERVLDLADFPVLTAHVFGGRPVVPLVLLLEWLAHAALHQNPGLKFHGCDDLRILHGVILDGAVPTIRVGAGKATRREGFFVVPAEVRGKRAGGPEVLHARAEIILATELPPPPEPRSLSGLGPAGLQPAEAYCSGALFHGPALQGLERVDGCDERGISGRAHPAPPPAQWMRQPLRQRWLADPLLLDSSFQLLILWSRARRGGANLPCHLRRYRQYRPSCHGSTVQIVASVPRATSLHALADIDFLDDSGLLARVEGYECVIDPSLDGTFQRKQLPATEKFGHSEALH